MRLFLSLIGMVLVIAGGVWIFQGAGVLKGSFMTGESQWLFIGIAAYTVLFTGPNAGGEAGHLGGAIVGWLLKRLPRPLYDFAFVQAPRKPRRPI